MCIFYFLPPPTCPCPSVDLSRLPDQLFLSATVFPRPVDDVGMRAEVRVVLPELQEAWTRGHVLHGQKQFRRIFRIFTLPHK